MMDYKALAKQFGAVEQQIAQPQSPQWAAGLSPKDQAELNMKLYEEGRKRVSSLDSEISQAQPVINDLEEFGRLNRETSTGSLWDNVLPGTPFLHGANIDKMQTIQSRLGPAQRPTGSGASSDTDVRLFMGGLPSVKQGGDTNKGIRTDFQRKLDYAVGKRNAMQQYLNKFGNLNGFDEQWNTRPSTQVAPSSKPATGLTQAEQEELQQLRKRFGK